MKKNKLKNMLLTSVDLCKRGANQEADIVLKKSMTDEEQQEYNEMCVEALTKSLQSIIADETLDAEEKSAMAEESITQFAKAYMPLEDIEDTAVDTTKTEKEGNTMEYTIDKSLFTPEELEQYEQLVAKASCGNKPVAKEDDPDDPAVKATPPKKKYIEVEDDDDDDMVEIEASDDGELHPAVKKALEEMEEMKKSYEMREMHEVAKKYASLGKKEDELAETLYDMKKSSPNAYDSYVAVLDEQLDLVEKSGLFGEIGKSGRGLPAGANTVDKIENIATEIQKSEPTMSRMEAINKAWEQHPELVAEYEEEYQGGK